MQIAARVAGAVVVISAVFASAAQAAPVATTGSAESVTTGSAVIAGTVNPGGEATTYQVEYGTSSSYGLTSPAVDAGAGSAPANVRVTLTGLSSATTYHYRVVARSASGESAGVDRTLRTATPARAPSVSLRTTRGLGATGATIGANVNPRGQATTVRFEYGTSASYGARTAEQQIGAGSRDVAATAALTGLRPNTRYHFRAVATSAAGVTRSGDRTFTTARVPTGVTIALSTARPVWGSGATVSGTVSGAGATPVALERQDFPFSGPFTPVATTTTSSRGAFTMTVPPLFATAGLRVVTRTAVPVSSRIAIASVAVKVGLKTIRLRGKRTRIEGAIWPAVPQGRVSLQRRTRSGRWMPVTRARITSLPGNRSRYRFSAVARRGRALRYRVVVLARNGGANVPGTSRTITIPRR